MPAKARGAGTSDHRLVCDIARGGMGRVELVVRKDDDFVRLYARKRVLAGLGDDADVRAMFRDEARIAGMLRHPNVVGVYDVGEDDEGMFLLMDYVEGIPLSQLVRGVKRRGARMPVQICARIVEQVAEGLHAAHELRDLDGKPLDLVHRDVSPSNVMLDLNGVVRVLDFGIAKAIGRRARTSTGLLKGKAGYLAPEVLRFEPADRRADLFSLGVVLYEALTGDRLYGGDDITKVARRIIDEPPPDVGAVRNDVPDALVELCFELLAKSPEHRPATAREVADRLREVIRDLLDVEDPISLEDYAKEHIDAAEITRRRRLAEEVRAAPEPSPRRRTAIFVGAAVLLLAIGSAVGLALFDDAESAGDTLEPPVAAAPSEAQPAPSAAPEPGSREAAGEASAGESREPRPETAEAGELETDRAARARRRARAARRRRARTAMDSPAMESAELEPWGWE